MSTSNGNGHTIAFRVGELEKDVRELQGISRGLPERIEQLERSQEKLSDSLGKLSRDLFVEGTKKNLARTSLGGELQSIDDRDGLSRPRASGDEKIAVLNVAEVGKDCLLFVGGIERHLAFLVLRHPELLLTSITHF